jgi:glutathione S-transferase
MLQLFDSRLSGNGWKVRLLLNHLGIRYERRILDLKAGEARTPEFTRLNPLARIPVVRLDDGTTIRESNAILMHFAEGTAYLPGSPLGRARVMEWLFFEQYDHLKNFARPRFLVSIARSAQPSSPEIRELHAAGHKALSVMEQALAESPFLVGGDYTIADIALFPYTSMAGEGGYDLTPYKAVAAWIGRVRQQPGFVPLFTQSSAS